MTADRGSKRKPILTENSPDGIQVKRTSSICRPVSGIASRFTNDFNPQRNDNPTEPQPIIEISFLFNRPKSRPLIRNPTKGNKGIRYREYSIPPIALPF